MTLLAATNAVPRAIPVDHLTGLRLMLDGFFFKGFGPPSRTELRIRRSRKG
jgi:hypothetical protein